MEEIKFYKTKAIKIVRAFQKENMYINQWCTDSGVSYCYVFFVNDKTVAVALISKCNFDPLKTQRILMH